MTTECNRIQDQLAENGAAAMDFDARVAPHLAICDECRALLESLDAVDAALRDLDSLDPPDSVVLGLLDGIASELHSAPGVDAESVVPLEVARRRAQSSREHDEPRAPGSRVRSRRPWLLWAGAPIGAMAAGWAALLLSSAISLPEVESWSEPAANEVENAPARARAASASSAELEQDARFDSAKADLPESVPTWYRSSVASVRQGPSSAGAEPRAISMPTSESLSERAAEPLPEPLLESTSEPLLEPLSEPLLQPFSERLPKAVPKAVSKPLSKPVSKPVAEPSPKPASETAPASALKSASETGEGAIDIEEITVTARKREETLEQTPIAITAFTATDIEDRDIRQIEELTSSVPTLQFDNATGNTSSARIYLRGVGDGDPISSDDPGVGIYLDGVFLPREEGALLTLEDGTSVQVLRGPQGTLFAKNTIGGAVSITTRRPTLTGWATAVGMGDLALLTNCELRSFLPLVKPANGYFANRYLPGDPTQRLLTAQLSRALPEELGIDPYALALGSEPLRSALARPTTGSMAVSLHADHASLPDSRRLLVRVGLQAADRALGQRGPVNGAIVVDLRESLDDSAKESLRALVLALSEFREPNDRLRLIVVGRGHPLRVESDAFRYGPVSVALDELLGDRVVRPKPSERGALASDADSSDPGPLGSDADSSDAIVSLAEGLTLAEQQLGGAADRSPLGTSFALLVTTKPLGVEREAVGRAASGSARRGITVSTVGIGSGVGLEELAEVALLGEGQRSWMTRPGQAHDIIEAEFRAQSRVVARALRLAIRLAPGVRLLDVLGSERLDSTQADEVRRAESALDARLERELGITADRGQDEDGIQIVIPGFYAGDSHSILLDVVAERPGPVAEVRLRYKDMVALANSEAHAALSLDSEKRERGALEWSVTKSWIRLETSHALERASQLLSEGAVASARSQLESAKTRLELLRAATPLFASDSEVAADTLLVDRYLSALGASEPGSERARWLVRSLALAAWRALFHPLAFG